MYAQTRSDLQPFTQAGQSAISALMGYWGLGAPGGSYPGGANVPGGAGGVSPGMAAARQGGFVHTGNASPIQDISAALAKGIPVSDAAWAKAGYGPGGSLPGQTGGTGQPTIGPTLGGSNTPGANAFSMLSQFPGYQFQYGQGLEALNRNLSAGGRFTSGAMLKDAQTYGQGQAQSAVTNYLDMLKYLGNLGQNSAAQTGQAGTAAAGQAGNFLQGQGAANAAGSMGASNAITGLLQNQNFQGLFSSGGGGGGAIGYGSAFGNAFGG